ncbi:MAG: EAL domain-containing protein [Hyphomicrobiales bacterium]
MRFWTKAELLTRMQNALLIAILMIAALGILRFSGVTDALDRLLWEERFSASYRPVSGSIVVLDIDARSLEKLGVWPIPRRIFAELTDKLAAAGAQDIVFDIDFSSSSNPEDDTLFSEAIERAGNVSLAAFRQAATTGLVAGDEVLNQPIEQFLDAAWPVVVMVPVEKDSRIWRSLYGYPLAGSDEVSAAALLGEFTGQPHGTFWLDYSIAIDEIGRVSLVDVLSGEVAADLFEGKKVVIGASAQELRDLFPVPVHEILPGAVIQALGAETILQDRALIVRGELLALALVFVIYLLFMMTRVEGLPVKILIFVLAALALEAAAYAILQKTPVLVATGSAHFLVIFAAIVIVLRELGFHKVISHLSQIGQRNSERMLGQVFDDSFDAIIVVDRSGKITAASQIARELFGIRSQVGVYARDVLPGELVDEAINALAKSTAVRPIPKTFKMTTADGSHQFIEYVVTRSEKTVASKEKIGNQENQALACLTCRDVTDERESADQLAFLAKYDPVTTLLNRNGFEEEVALQLETARKQSRRLCLIQFSISNLDQIIASLGYSYGDRVRQSLAMRLKNHFNQESIWAALGVDIFAGTLMVVPGGGQDLPLIEAIQRVIGEDYMIDGARISVRLDFGFIIDNANENFDVDTLMKKSGNALSKIRRNDRMSVLAFHPDMDKALQRRRYLETELFKAVVRDELRMVYQPLVDIRDGSIVAAEALLRWNHRKIGEISPSEFISIAEENGYIVELGAWALNRAMKEASTWNKPINLSINMSAMQFSRGDIVSTVTEAIERSGFPAERLDLEITETLFVDDTIDLKTSMEKLKSIGCSFSLDDFGTGYSSMGYLPKYPFSKIKLDRTFIESLSINKKDAALVQAVLDMASAYEMETVIEGVETQEQADILLSLGCRIGQGFLFGRPIDAPDFALVVDDAA